MMAKRRTPLEDEHIEVHMCDLELRMYVLRQLPFFKELSQRDIRKINTMFVEYGYQAGEVIYFEKSAASRLNVIADGNVKLMQNTIGGKEVMLDILGQGEFFGGLTQGTQDVYSETAQAHTPVCTLSIEGKDFRQVMAGNPSVALNVMDIMAERLVEAHEMMSLLSVASVDQRLAHVLLKMGEKLGEPDEVGLLIQMPLGRGELAELTGTTPETASRIMSQFQKWGLIQTGRRWVAIKDKNGLAAISEN